ncbi:MAG: hypothetical protein WBN03_05985 [Desulfobacterales bacterium]
MRFASLPHLSTPRDGRWFSLKYALYRIEVKEHLLVWDAVELAGQEDEWLWLEGCGGCHLEERHEKI